MEGGWMCVYVCACVSLHVCMYMCVCTCVFLYVYLQVFVCVSVQILHIPFISKTLIFTHTMNYIQLKLLV